MHESKNRKKVKCKNLALSNYENEKKRRFAILQMAKKRCPRCGTKWQKIAKKARAVWDKCGIGLTINGLLTRKKAKIIDKKTNFLHACGHLKTA